MAIAKISPKQLFEMIQAGQPVELIDVRTPVEYREVHVACARNVPLDQLDTASLARDRSSGATQLYVICRSGARSQKACEQLVSEGLPNVVSVDGGTAAWDLAGLPVVRGKKAIGLERQVRIVAGTMVLVGSLLGAFVNPWWIALAGFVGAGLIYAGVTDTCGMGMLLARMPWNQVGGSTSSSTCCGPATKSSVVQGSDKTTCCQ